ncbi:MAG: thiamine diphosphokinase [Opitutales bacterium]
MRVVIVLGGDPPGSVLMDWRIKGADFSIAADAGMQVFVAEELEPDLLIGDLDSFDPSQESLSCEIARIRDQGQTDFQKALARPELQDADEVVVLGGTGGRSDHFLNNLLIAAGLPGTVKVIFDADMEIIYRVTPERPLALEDLDGQTVSIIPMGDCTGVSASGLRWPLAQVAMGSGNSLSQSNLAVAERVEVCLDQGTLYVVVLKH